MIKQRLESLRKKIKENGIDVYYFNTSDYHLSEYVPEYFKTIAYFSGFTGSLATLLVSQKEAVIFVDGRYHIQADNQCLKNDVKVVKLGTSGALEPIDYLKQYYDGQTVGFDGKRTSISFGKQLIRNKLKIKSVDIYSELIENRAPLSKDRLFELSIKYTGLTRKKKIDLVNYCLEGYVHIVNNLESIAYLLNLRGNDITYTPTFLSYLVIKEQKVYLFVNKNRISDEIYNRLLSDSVIIKEYDEYYDFLKTIRNQKILFDETKVNFETYISLINRNNSFFNKRSIIEDMKSIKNPVEQENAKLAHIYDGVALTRFLMWLEKADKSTLTEYDVAMMINKFRTSYRAFDLSFSSIVAYNQNAAIMHYFPEKGKSKVLDNSGILLMDTGGQYLEGTTDITRTVALGPVDPEIKRWFTLVLKSMFNLSDLRFLKGMRGNQIDVVARKDLWAEGVNYRCGTGHGVGQTLSVHENPPNIRYGKTENGSDNAELKPGMIFSDEPGVYFDNQFGIRCENLLLCKKDFENEYGEFYSFETITMVPFDLDLIDKRYLDLKTVKLLNSYHKTVYETLSPLLTSEEKEFLRRKTRAI